MKDDVQIPTAVPRKRRELERVLDVWIATWLAGALTPSERRRLLEEKQRRKRVRAVGERKVGVLIGGEGVTQAQFQALVDALTKLSPTEIHHPGVSSRVHMACRACGVPVIVHDGRPDEVVRASQLVIGAPKTAHPTKSSVWESLRYARHRRLALTIIDPEGNEQE